MNSKSGCPCWLGRVQSTACTSLPRNGWHPSLSGVFTTALRCSMPYFVGALASMRWWLDGLLIAFGWATPLLGSKGMEANLHRCGFQLNSRLHAEWVNSPTDAGLQLIQPVVGIAGTHRSQRALGVLGAPFCIGPAQLDVLMHLARHSSILCRCKGWSGPWCSSFWALWPRSLKDRWMPFGSGSWRSSSLGWLIAGM